MNPEEMILNSILSNHHSSFGLRFPQVISRGFVLPNLKLRYSQHGTCSDAHKEREFCEVGLENSLLALVGHA